MSSQLQQFDMMTSTLSKSFFLLFQILPDFSSKMICAKLIYHCSNQLVFFVKWLETANLGITQLIKLQLIMTYWTDVMS